MNKFTWILVGFIAYIVYCIADVLADKTLAFLERKRQAKRKAAEQTVEIVTEDDIENFLR